jgi:uncharacterized membrane protein
MARLNIEALAVILVALAINLLFALILVHTKRLQIVGAVAGFVSAVSVFVAFKWQGYVMLAGVLVISHLAPQIAIRLAGKSVGVKPLKKIGARHVAADMAVPLVLAWGIMAATEYYKEFPVYFASFCASIAVVLADRLSDTLGRAYGSKWYLLITMERAKAGAAGAVSIEGVVIGLLAAASVAFTAAGLGMFPTFPIKTAILITSAALIANVVLWILAGIIAQFRKNANDLLLRFIATFIAATLCFIFVNQSA